MWIPLGPTAILPRTFGRGSFERLMRLVLGQEQGCETRRAFYLEPACSLFGNTIVFPTQV